MPTESYYTAKLTAELRQIGAIVIPLVAGVKGVAGMPDRYVCHSVWDGFIEAKAKDGKLTTLQAYIHRQLNGQRAGKVFVVRYLSPKLLAIEYHGEEIGRIVWDAMELLWLLEHYTISIGGRG